VFRGWERNRLRGFTVFLKFRRPSADDLIDALLRNAGKAGSSGATVLADQCDDVLVLLGRVGKGMATDATVWKRVAERLGVSVSTIMMVLRGDRNLSAKALFRLEEAEREVGGQRSSAEQFVEGLIGGREAIDGILGRRRKGQETAEVAVDYVASGETKSKLPVAVCLVIPSQESCRKLRSLFAETLDTRLIALACLPEQLRSESYLDLLTPASRARLTNAALGLVIPDWRTLAVTGVG
jgi:transcriptional regulator with XRE-family HTH domain